LTHILNALLSMLGEMAPYILLGFLFAGILHAFVNPRLMTRHLSGNGFKEALKAALVGVPLPLCSCGVLPTAISLRRSGASTAATTSFLIATPQTGVDSIAATYSLLGPAFALLRPIAALLSAILGGTLIGKLTHEMHLPDDDTLPHTPVQRPVTLRSKVCETLRYGFVDMVGSVGKWLVIGLVVAALITVLVPDDFFVRFARYPLVAMLAVVIIAIPMYVCATGSIPIALSLMMKGLTPGVAFVFLMAGPAVNFASYTLLSRAMGRRNTLLYIAIIALSAIGIGLVVDYLFPAVWFLPQTMSSHACCEEHTLTLFESICSATLVALLLYALVIRRFTEKKPLGTAARTYRIDGMTCVHCKARVEQGLNELEGVISVRVDIDKKIAQVEGTVQDAAIAKKVTDLGYDYIGTLP
jgi:hypothetical protein